MKNLFLLLSLSFVINAQSLNFNAIVKYAKKGKKIVNVLCDKDKLPKAKGTIEEIEKAIINSKACSNLSKNDLKAVVYYISNGDIKENSQSLNVPKDAKCPVCGMFVGKYPKWASMMEVNGKKHYFDGVKDMMKYYFFDGDFKYDRNKITQMKVSDYYTLKAIDAKSAFYVYNSKKFGPMGRELIPFVSKKEAQNFIRDYGGKLMKFSDITPKKVMALDGIEMK